MLTRKLLSPSELQGYALNWAVAKAEGKETRVYQTQTFSFKMEPKGLSEPRLVIVGEYDYSSDDYIDADYSTNWTKAGPIIDLYDIQLTNDPMCSWGKHQANIRATPFPSGYGETKLIAAMRCYVEFRLGQKIEVPEQLLCTIAKPT